jgi:hypothetical protein
MDKNQFNKIIYKFKKIYFLFASFKVLNSARRSSSTGGSTTHDASNNSSPSKKTTTTKTNAKASWTFLEWDEGQVRI